METSNVAPRRNSPPRLVEWAAHLAALGPEARRRALTAAAAEAGVEFVDPPPTAPDSTVARVIPAPLARARGVLPWRWRDGGLDVLCGAPPDEELAPELRFVIGAPVRLWLAEPAEVERRLARSFPDAETEAGTTGAGASHDGGTGAAPAAWADLAASAPVVRFVADVLERAVAQGASDIHFEPWADALRVRCRIDGALREFARGGPELALAAASRLKVLANLDVAERRRPQDGRIRGQFAGRAIDLRVATLPTQDGESVVLRVLDPANAGRGLDALALPAETLTRLRAVLARPSGLVVVTGPTGSGKTTTLYGCLRELNRREHKILTVEDPVEYEIDGVTQVAVQPAIGLTFAAALRSFLRQDPDIVMVGEIRDRETAQIATQAALTGHLVLATLHTNDARGAVERLVDLGVEPYLVASVLEAVLAQRLVRRICERCRCRATPTEAQAAELATDGDALPGREFFAGRGCAACDDRGYRGRLGLFEWFEPNEAIRQALGRSGPAGAGGWREVLRAGETARGGLRAAGLAAAAAGVTSLDEVLQATGA